MWNYHVNNLGWSDIGYNFMIGGDGSVYVGGGWDRVGVHTRGHNADSIGIAFIGDFTNAQPNGKMTNTAAKLLTCGVEKGKLAWDYGLYGQRDGSCSSGPGNAFYAILSSWPRWHALGKLKKSC